jgi:hypothetical protein
MPLAIHGSVRDQAAALIEALLKGGNSVRGA